jgi:D-sedoheptulose 7-phosphate isomerase
VDNNRIKQLVLDGLAESLAVKERFFRSNLDLIVAGVDRITECLVSQHKLLIFGNGGSAADAQHIAAEFVNRFQLERRPLPAIALTTDTSIITSIGNDYHFDQIFAKQLEALGCRGDVALGISTSGNSPNVVRAMQSAQQMGLYTIGFTGRGGQLAQFADLVLAVASEATPRIQETHITLAHILCDLVERNLFEPVF